jgi:hypothetical protein
VLVVIGPGYIGDAIARRVGVGKRLLLADLRQENAEAAAEVLSNAGYDASTTTFDVSFRASISTRNAVLSLVRKRNLSHTRGNSSCMRCSEVLSHPTLCQVRILYFDRLVDAEVGGDHILAGVGCVVLFRRRRDVERGARHSRRSQFRRHGRSAERFARSRNTDYAASFRRRRR